MDDEQLLSALRGFDIPSHRHNLSRGNLEWLYLNLAKKNAGNPKLASVFECVASKLGPKFVRKHPCVLSPPSSSVAC